MVEREDRDTTMYTVDEAAGVIGVSERTVRRWIKEDKINVVVVKNRRNQVCLTFEDLMVLINRHRPLKVNRAELEEYYPELKDMYSIEDVGRMLGVKSRTASEWIRRLRIERKVVTADKRRVYVSYQDIVAVAREHNRLISYGDREPVQTDGAQEDSPSQEEHFFQVQSVPQEARLYTLEETARFLGVSEITARGWLSLYNVEKRTVDTDKQRIYIAYGDIVMLAMKQKRESVCPVHIATDIREIRCRLEKIEEGMLGLEKYIKRSIFLGK